MNKTKEKSLRNKSLHVTCDFCLLPNRGSSPTWDSLYGSKYKQLLAMPTTPSFYVAQNIVPIGNEGLQFLLIPKTGTGGEHPISLAQVKEQNQLEQATTMLVERLQKMYPNRPVFAFEHGPGEIEGEMIACGACHEDHAHANFLVLPSGQDYWNSMQSLTEEALLNSGWTNPLPSERRKNSSRLFSSLKDIAGDKPYLHMGMIYPDGNTTTVTYIQSNPGEIVASQLLRKIAAQAVYNTTDSLLWNWRDAVMLEDRVKLLAGVNDFRTNELLSDIGGVVYISTAHTAGRRFFEALQKYGVTSLDQLNTIDPQIYLREVLEANIAEARRFGRVVRRSSGNQTVFQPVLFSEDFSNLDLPRSLFRNMILKEVKRLRVNRNWSESVGQTNEVRAGLEKGIKVDVEGESHPLSKSEVIETLRRSLRRLEGKGFDTSDIEEHLRGIENYREVHTIFQSGK